MRVVIQRVSRAKVSIEGRTHAECGPGMLVLVGLGRDDTQALAERMVEKILSLRIFADATGRMNQNLVDVGGELLLVSQFTLVASTERGLRPSFSSAMPPADAQRLFQYFVDVARNRYPSVYTGVFGADMQVELVNDGPVTFVMDL